MYRLRKRSYPRPWHQFSFAAAAEPAISGACGGHTVDFRRFAADGVMLQPEKIRKYVSPFTSALAGPCFVRRRKLPGFTPMIYGDFEIRSFEAGKGLWHASIQRADQQPVVIDGIAFPTLEIGFAWSDRDAAVADAKTMID
ncbi:hypothetical protein, partial [Bradyrhizobium sp.]|uniref:hypothetical protein n=1 Tax=Bradyrhizobium sp. TaxID=376 RepID=UPI003C71431B